MNKIKILISDDNMMAATLLYDKLSVYGDFELIGVARDGIETIEIAQKEKPDVILLDIIMPKLDGIGVLEHLKAANSGYNPIFIVFSAVSQENYIARAMSLGANYYILKPFDETVIASRIRQLYAAENTKQFINTEYQKLGLDKKQNNPKKPYDDELMVLATKYMREYGLKAHMTGYNYIRGIIIDAFDSYCQTGSLPKGIYRSIAVKNNVSVQKVERAIRNCIESVKTDDDNAERKPTNSQVICQLIEKIRINN
jgi:two-component system response regulator (stage 0 sporulation protein A)